MTTKISFFLLLAIVIAGTSGVFLLADRNEFDDPGNSPSSEVTPVSMDDALVEHELTESIGDSDRYKDWKLYASQADFQFFYPNGLYVFDGSIGLPQTEVLLYLCQQELCSNSNDPVLIIQSDKNLFADVDDSELIQRFNPTDRVLSISDERSLNENETLQTEVRFESGGQWIIVKEMSKKIIINSPPTRKIDPILLDGVTSSFQFKLMKQ